MFAKLRTNRYMQARGNDSAAVVEFTGKVQRIARVHQLELKDKPSPKSAAIKYPQRQLLGFPTMTCSLWKASLLTTSLIELYQLRFELIVSTDKTQSNMAVCFERRVNISNCYHRQEGITIITVCSSPGCRCSCRLRTVSESFNANYFFNNVFNSEINTLLKMFS